MAKSSSDATAMAWNFVIQSVARFDKADSSTLAGLVEKAPAISVNKGKDAKDMVSLRMLESLFPLENVDEVDSDSAQNAGISFQPEEHCQDILHKILEETSEPIKELDRRKWNIRPFITHKRASLSKPPVQKVKEALLNRSHLTLESLKELSKLRGAEVSENIVPVIDVGFNAQTRVDKGDSLFRRTESENSKLPKSPLQKSDHVEDSNRLDTGRKEDDLTIELSEKDLEESTLMDHVEHIETENLENDEHETAVEPSVKDLENTLIDHVEHVGSPSLKRSCDHANIGHAQQQPPGEDDNEDEHQMTTEPSLKDLKNTLMDHVEHIESKSLEPSCEKAGEDDYDDHDDDHVYDDDDDDDDDERTEIAAKKEAFFSSQFTVSQDFIATQDFTEISLCMKCNKGGQLLICSSDACPFRVHESCLSSSPTSDRNENFLCPFCSYSLAISKYMEIKKKACLARKDLQAFFRSGVKDRPKIPSNRGVCLDENTSTQIGATGEKFKSNCNQHATDSGKDCAPAHSLNQPTREAGMAKQPSKEQGAGSSMCSPSKRTHTQEPQCISPTITLGRRKKLFWDKAEEEILKAGVQKFSCADNKRIPWKQILDFGRDVFDKSRNAIDLKDKWRNMCKENLTTKKQKL